jgi:hypothetical protein
MRALALLALLACARAGLATHPCVVISAQREANARARAAIPEGRELLKEFTTFHEYFADVHDAFSRSVEDMYAAFECGET